MTILRLAVAICVACSAVALGPSASADWNDERYEGIPVRPPVRPGEFVFCRIRYTSYGEEPDRNVEYGRWRIDYPRSDENFMMRLSECTTIRVPREANGHYQHVVISLTDPAIYDYPFIYIVEPGRLTFSDAEVACLRDYLMRGGFLMVDDFWGHAEWENWETEFSRVLDPKEFPIVPLPLSHPIFNYVFQLKEKPQVPGIWFWTRTGSTSERGAESAVVDFRGVYDKRGRLISVMCHNTDNGDGWEREGDNKEYFDEFSVKKAYPLGINIVSYIMTH